MGLSCLHRLFGGRLIAGLSAAALLVFVLSSFQMGRVGHDQQASEFQEAVVADFEHIRTIAETGQSVFVTVSYRWFAGEGRAVGYYLAGRMIGRSWPAWSDSFAYDFFVSRQRIDVPALLTPDNRQIFLYRQSDYSTQIDEMIRKSEPVIRRDDYFDVYRSGNRLIYVRNRGEDRAAQFIRQDIPIAGKPLYVALSPCRKPRGLHRPERLAVGARRRCRRLDQCLRLRPSRTHLRVHAHHLGCWPATAGLCVLIGRYLREFTRQVPIRIGVVLSYDRVLDVTERH